MSKTNTTGARIGIATAFLFVLVAAAVLYYPPPSHTGSFTVQAMSMPSDNCIACHTNPSLISALGTGSVAGAGGG